MGAGFLATLLVLFQRPPSYDHQHLLYLLWEARKLLWVGTGSEWLAAVWPAQGSLCVGLSVPVLEARWALAWAWVHTSM